MEKLFGSSVSDLVGKLWNLSLSNGQPASTPTTSPKQQRCLVATISDDVWINMLTQYTFPDDVLSFRQCSHHFHSLTDPRSPVFNRYWKHQCTRVANLTSLECEYPTNKWFKIYSDLCQILTTKTQFDGKYLRVHTTEKASKLLMELTPEHKGPICTLHEACQYNLVYILDMFLFLIQEDHSSKLDINATTHDLDHILTKIYDRFRRKQTKKVQVVHKQFPQNLVACTSEQRSLLHIACFHGSEKTVRYLLKYRNISINGTNNGKNMFTPLMIACKMGWVNIVRMLITHSKSSKSLVHDLNSTNSHGHTALDIALDARRKLVAAALLNTGAVSVDYNKEIQLAVIRGEWKVFRMLLQYNKKSIFGADHSGMTAFMWAAMRGDKKNLLFIHSFLVSNINGKQSSFDEEMIAKYINQKEKRNGRTAYILACRSCAKETVRALVEVCGVDVTIKDKNGCYGSDLFCKDTMFRKSLRAHEIRRSEGCSQAYC